MKPRSGVDIDAELTALENLSYATLKEMWQALYGVPAPKKIGTESLRLAVAYGLQEKAFGGLKPKVRRQLMRLAGEQDGAEADRPKAASALQSDSLRPGARLIREWNGETHQVEVVDSGFVWRGKTYRSLTAVAFTITGARWSGPRFFGLNKTAEAGLR